MFTFDKTCRVLVVGAHPDDEIMCGGLITRMVEQGCQIYHYYFAECRISTQDRGYDPELLIQECRQSRATLGIPDSHCGGFDFPVRHFPEYRQQILDALLSIRRAVAPTIVLTSGTDDIHQDHSTLTHEVIRAFKGSTILGYESPWNQLATQNDMLVKLNQSHLDNKIAAMSAYQTQSQSPYFQPDFITGLARVRGVQAGSQYAESYEVVRLVM